MNRAFASMARNQNKARKAAMNHVTAHRAGVQIPAKTLGFILSATSAIGIDVRSILKSANIPYRASSSTYLPSGNLSQTQISSVYRDCVTALNASVFAPTRSRSLTGEKIDLFCSCLINCGSLGEVIERAIVFVNNLDPLGNGLSLQRHERDAQFSFIDNSDQLSTPALIVDVVALLFFYKLFSWLIAEPLQVSRMTVCNCAPADKAVFAELIDVPITYRAASNSLFFSNDMLHRPVVRNYREWVQLSNGWPIALMPLPRAKRCSSQLELIIRRNLATTGEIPGIDRAASLMGKKGPALRRRLAQENTSYQQLVDKCRMERALEFFQQPDMTLEDISYGLGFSSANGFSRAFKEWTGIAPSVYRQALLEGE